MKYLGSTTKRTEWSKFISKASHSTWQEVIQVYAPTTDAEEAEVDQFYEIFLELPMKF